MRTTYEEIFELLGIKNVTSRRQRKNGTHVFEIPFETRSGENIRLATYKSGDHKVRIPITRHEERLEFLLKYIIRNYYKKQHTITKWKTYTHEPNISVTVNGNEWIQKYRIQ